MTRRLRTDEIGAVHHVIIRGVDGCTIFRCAADFEDFLARFELLLRELGIQVLAWSLLGNHAHFILKTGDVPLAKLMARLSGRHAQRFNRVARRKGHLFQGRYRAFRITDDARLARDTAYVLGNPLRHQIVTPPGLGAYAFGGYGALVGSRPPRAFESIERMAAALGVERAQTGEFVCEQALAADAACAALEPDQVSELNLLVRSVCLAHGVPREALRASLSPEARPLRREILVRATRCLELPVKTIASEIGLSYGAARRITARLHAERSESTGSDPTDSPE
jgi:REP element-mobilizing transposase RayT